MLTFLVLLKQPSAFTPTETPPSAVTTCATPASTVTISTPTRSDLHRFSVIGIYLSVVLYSISFPTENITTLAGSLRGNADGQGVKSCFNGPASMCINPHDECLYVCDKKNSAIKIVTMLGISFQNLQISNYFFAGKDSTFVGRGLDHPNGIVMNHKENLFYVTNYFSHTIAKITISGLISLFHCVRIQYC